MGPHPRARMKKNLHSLERERRENGKKSQTKPESNQGRKMKDLSKIKSFHCHEYEHYATKCPQNEASEKTLGGAVGEALDS